jgi:hypothetical protein
MSGSQHSEDITLRNHSPMTQHHIPEDVNPHNTNTIHIQLKVPYFIRTDKLKQQVPAKKLFLESET